MLSILCWLWATVALATTPPIERAVDAIDRLYLHRADVDAGTLLQASARELAGRFHWLMVTPHGASVALRHGDGRDLGTVEVQGMADLPRALGDLAARVARVETSSETTPPALERALLKGLARGLDRYSRVLVDDRIDGFSVRLSGTESGVGVTLRASDAASVVVDDVVPGGPAASAGLAPGDRMLSIDGQGVTSVNDARTRLRGVAGTAVLVAVQGGAGPRAVSLRRARVVVPNVTHRVLPGRVGYVHIEHVSQRTVQNLVAAFDGLAAQGALERGLVVDLRDNTGGSMKEAARVADLFVSDGLLLRTASRDGGPIENLQHEMRARQRPDDLRMPVVVVVNERTASGAEILAGALVEHARAAIVGQRTYGKGTVQKPLPLGEGLQLNLTVANYVLQNERRITSKGIVPDVWVGHVAADERGLAFQGWPASRDSWTAVVPAVATAQDIEVELARRTVLAVTAAGEPAGDRATVLDALTHHAEAMRREGADRLTRIAAAGGIDWAPATDVGPVPDVDVELVTRPLPDGRLQLEAEVISREEADLARVVVQLRSVSRGLEGLAVAVGRVPAGGRGRGAIVIDEPAPGPDRIERVEAFVRSAGRPGVPSGRHLLTLPARGTPRSRGPQLVVDEPGLAVAPAPLVLPIAVEDRGGVPVDHVVVWANGHKVAWSAGEGPGFGLRPVIGIGPGPNRILVEAVDVEGRTSEVRLQLLGLRQPEPVLSMDATGSVD